MAKMRWHIMYYACTRVSCAVHARNERLTIGGGGSSNRSALAVVSRCQLSVGWGVLVGQQVLKNVCELAYTFIFIVELELWLKYITH